MADPGTQEPVEESSMSLGDHLDELRRRLFRGVLAVGVAFVVAYLFRTELRGIMDRPWMTAVQELNRDLAEIHEAALVEDPETPRDLYFEELSNGQEILRDPIPSRLLVTGPFENFLVSLKVALYAALFVGGPYLLWELWGFIAAGLYKREQRVVLAYLPASILLFFTGITFAYLTMVPYGIYFLNRGEALLTGRPDIRASEYLSFLSILCFGLGLVFQVPILMTAVARVGLVEPATFARLRGHFVLGSFVLAALFTPPDPYTQAMMAIPMILLYEVGIWTARLAARRHLAESHEAGGGAVP